jgi:hypothetical protein
MRLGRATPSVNWNPQREKKQYTGLPGQSGPHSSSFLSRSSIIGPKNLSAQRIELLRVEMSGPRILGQEIWGQVKDIHNQS